MSTNLTQHPLGSVLIYLANGVQGQAAVQAALRHGLAVRAIVRDRNRARALADQGVEVADGDLDDLPSLIAAGKGMDAVVLQVPIGPQDRMQTQAFNAVSAAQACGIGSLILRLASASRPPPCEEGSFEANAAVEQVVAAAGVPFAVVRPTMYLENLLKPSARADIVRNGVFEPPIDASQRIAWTSVADCADAAIRLLKRGALGGDHLIAGPDSVDGNELAARLSEGLGRPVVYRSQAIDRFESEVDAAMGAGVGRRVASKFRYFAAHPIDANRILAQTFSSQPGLEGFAPTSISDWLKQHRREFLGDR